MGRLALVLIVILGVTTGIVAYSINLSKRYTIENVVGFEKYTTARNIAHTGVNLMLHTLDEEDTSYINAINRGEKVWIVKNVLGGICSVSVKLTNPAKLDTIDMTSNSIYVDTSYRMTLRLQRFPKPFPDVGAAVGLASSPIAFDMNGTPKIDGRDHFMNGALVGGTTDTIGVAVTTVAESTLVAAFNSKLTGDPRKVAIQPSDDPGNYVQEYINGKDYDFGTGSYNGNYGTKAAPVIGYVHGDVKFTGNGSFYGVLVIDGTIDMQGTYDIYGLVICMGDDNVVATSAGTPEIHGGIIVTGNNTKFTMKGTSDVQYSTEALNMARYITKLLAYKVMKWYE